MCLSSDTPLLRLSVASCSDASPSHTACSPSWLDATAAGNKCFKISQLSAGTSPLCLLSPPLLCCLSILRLLAMFQTTDETLAASTLLRTLYMALPLSLLNLPPPFCLSDVLLPLHCFTLPPDVAFIIAHVQTNVAPPAGTWAYCSLLGHSQYLF